MNMFSRMQGWLGPPKPLGEYRPGTLRLNFLKEMKNKKVQLKIKRFVVLPLRKFWTDYYDF